jgi:hypothetical protein
VIYVPAVRPEKNTLEYELLFKIMNKLVKISKNSSYPMCTGGTMVMHKSIFTFLKGFKEQFISEDAELVLRALKFGITIDFMEHLYIDVSLRRQEYEGKLTTYGKLFIAAIQNFLKKGDLKDELFEYTMGGERYSQKEKTTTLKG